MRRPLIAGNWKMNLNVAQAVKLAEAVALSVKSDNPAEVLICPVSVSLYPVSEVLVGTPVRLGAQNVHQSSSGAFTGEISVEMARAAGCSHIILGHSERRAIFGEDDALINTKLKAVLNGRLTPILCVGEVLAERQSGDAERVVGSQIRKGFSGIGVSDALSSVIAYEPVWAIGTGETASPEQADAMHAYIRTVLTDMYGENAAESIRILYGGSVKADNADELMAKDNIDGALVGGASLKVESFLRIVHFQC